MSPKSLFIVLGLMMGLAAAKLGAFPQCAENCARTAATAAGCNSLDDDACLCAHPGFAKGAESCAQNTCQNPADRGAASNAFNAFALSCGFNSGGTTVTVTTTQSGSASASGSTSHSASGTTVQSSSARSSSASTTQSQTTKPTSSGTPTTTNSVTTPTTVTGSVSQSSSGIILTTAQGSTITQTQSDTNVPSSTTPSGTAVVMQTVVVPDPSATPITSAAGSISVPFIANFAVLAFGLMVFF